MLTQGDISPDAASALSASLDANDAPDVTARPELPDGSVNGVNPDMTYKGEQLPIDTGIQAAAPQEPAAPSVTAPSQSPLPAEPEPPPVVGQFQTSKGSTYDLHPDQSTTRNKAPRPDPGHEGDEGPKPKSEKTYFLTRQQAEALAPPQSRFRIVDHGDGHLSTATPAQGGGRNKWGISETQRHVGPVSLEPAEGLHPLEVWGGGKGQGNTTAYNSAHFGNDITQLGQNGRKAAVPAHSDEALLDVSRTQRDAATKERNVGQDQEPATPSLDVDRAAQPQIKFDDIPDHPASSAADAAHEAAKEPTPGQKEAENYKMGHSRMFGRDVSWENKRGSTRVAKDGSWKVDDLPYDYGHLLGTKGNDGDHLDIANIGTGDKHFVVDQRKTETGGFDEHKILANAKDMADAVDHYKRGFSDGRGDERLGSIKAATDEEIKAWASAPGAKRKPYDPDFKGPDSAPTEGTKPVPKVVTAAVTALKEKGLHDAADKLLAMEPSARIATASKYVNKTDAELKRPDRIRTPAAKVEGVGVTARSKADAARKAADVKAMDDAYAKLSHVGDEIPSTPETKQKLARELNEFNEATKGIKYKPNVKPASYLFQRAVRKLMTAKNPTEKSWTEFVATAKSLKEGGVDEVRASDRTEADIGRNKRSGDDAIAGAEAKAAGTNSVEDDMIASIDAKRKPFDLDAEHTESEAAPKPIKTSEDVKQFEAKTDKLDMAKPADRDRLSTETQKLSENLIKTADRKAPVGSSEDRAASAGKKIDIKSVDMKAIMAAMEKATKKNSGDPAAVRDEELGNYAEKPTSKARQALDEFFKDDNGALNIQKMGQDFRTSAKPMLKQFAQMLNDMFGYRYNARHFIADNILKQVVASKEKKLAEIAYKLDGHNDFWDTLTDKQQKTFQNVVETQKGQAFNKPAIEAQLNAAGYKPVEAALAADHAETYGKIYDWLWQEDKLHGSEEGYVQNYVPHIFEDAKGATTWINEYNKRLGATWYQKNRLFDTIAAAEKAGFKLKYTNPAEALNARMNASLSGHLLVDAARGLERDGLAVKAEDANDMQRKLFSMKRTLPDNNSWLFSPDVEALWKNSVEDKGFQGMQNAAGSIYRNWMRYKRISVPIQLSFSLFHEAHIQSIVVANELARAMDNVFKGDSLGKAYGGALKNIKQDLMDMPFGKLWGAYEHPGKRMQENYGKDNSSLAGGDKMWNQLFTEAGTSPFQATEDVIGAKRDLAKAQRAFRDAPDSFGKIGAGAKMALPAVMRGVERSQEWMFKNQIPRLKAVALQRDILDAIRHDPTLASNTTKRRAVLQELAKNNDDKFGEKFYKGWFINKALKDTALASFVSAGWNVGQARQVGGAAMDAGKMLQRMAFGDKRGPMSKAREDASHKISFVSHYVASTMLMAGGLSYALTGQIPTGLDYIFPRNGHDNDDGTAARLSTPFNTREGVMLKAHTDEHNSILGGIGQYIWNKTVLQPIVELATNKDFFGNRLWDTNAPMYKQIMQGADATLGRMFSPISATGMTRAYKQGGAGQAALAAVGFGPAPRYADQDATQRRIGHLYTEEGVADVKPYEYGPKTGLGHGGVQDIVRSIAGDRTEAEARQKGRADMLHGRATGDQETASSGARMLATEGHESGATIKAMQKGGMETYQFSRLPAAEQIAQASKMDDEHFRHYVLTNQNKGITKVARAVMIQQRKNNQ